MRTRSQSRENFPQQEASPAIVEPLRIENPFLEDQFHEDPPKDPPVATLTDNCTMAEMLRAPTEGYTEAIVILLILAEQFELKHNLIYMMTSEQFFGLEKDNPHDHIRWLKSCLPSNTEMKILSQSSLMNSSPPWTNSLRNEISNFEQKFGESFHEAWDRYKDLLRASLHHGFTELHQLNTFYNGLNPTDQDSLNVVAGGNLLERSTQDVLTIIENKSKVRNSRSKLIADNIQEYGSAAAANYNQGNPGYRPHMKAMQNQIDMVKNKLRNEMKTSIQTSLSNQTNEIRNMMASLLQMNTGSPSSSGTLPSNIVANRKSYLKAITTQSGVSYDGASISPLVVENAPEANKDTLIPTNNRNTEDIQPQAVSSKPLVSTSKPANTPVSASKPNLQALIPYPSRSFLKIRRALIDVFEEGDILILKALLNKDPSSPLQNQRNSFPEVSKELKIYEAKTEKSLVDEPPMVELKALPPHLEYAFLEDLSMEEKAALIAVLKSHKRAIAWKLSDIK
nr:hypothetical protein [Tanacetum cinerariifolium]